MKWPCRMMWQIKPTGPPGEDVWTPDTKLDKILTYCKRFPKMTFWLSDQHEVMRSFYKSIYLLSLGILADKMACCWRWGGYSARKCLSRHRLLVLFFVAQVGKRNFFKESPTSRGAHICIDLICRKRNIQWYKKIWKNQFEIRRYLIKFIKSKQE